MSYLVSITKYLAHSSNFNNVIYLKLWQPKYKSLLEDTDVTLVHVVTQPSPSIFISSLPHHSANFHSLLVTLRLTHH